MRGFVFAGALAFTAISPTAANAQAAPATADEPAPVDPVALALAHQILDTAFPPETRAQTFAKDNARLVKFSRAILIRGLRDTDPGLNALVDRLLARMFDQLQSDANSRLPTVYDAMARAYARTMSTDDLTQVLTFAKTSAGQHYFQHAEDLFNDPAVNAAKQRVFGNALIKRGFIEAAMRKEIADYIATHPEADKPH